MTEPVGASIAEVSISRPRRSWISWLGFPILGAILAGVVCLIVATSAADWPPYQSRATLLVEETPDAEQVGASAEGIRIAQQTIGALIVREPLTTTVAASLGNGLSADDLVSHVRIELPEVAPIVEIVVTHGDAEEAARIADALAVEAAAINSTFAGVSVLSRASTPERPLFNSYLLIAVAALLGGLVTLGGVAFADRQRRRIESVDDVLKRAQLPLLGVVAVSTPDGAARVRSREWAVAQLLVQLDRKDRSVLFTSPRKIATQEFFLGTLVSTDLATPELSIDDVTRNEVESVRDDDAWPTLQLERSIESLSLVNAQPADASSLRLVNGPPVLADANSILLAARFDAVVLLLETGTTTARDAQLAHRLLVESGANVLGSILLV